MIDMLEKILSGNNDFASGGLLLMIIGGLGVYLRAVPRKLWEWFACQTTMTITVKNDDAAFVWVKEWLLDQDFMRKVRRLDMDTTVRDESLTLIPAPGRHWFWHAGRPFVVEFCRSEETHGWSPRIHEWLSFTTVGRNRSVLNQFVAEVVACHKRALALHSHLYRYDKCWSRAIGYSPRPLESVILRPGEKELLIQDVETFLLSRDRYRELGVPYHRGYLFYGLPGTGKTSLASALAQRFGMSVYAINLTRFNDHTLTSAINEVPAKSMVLFEEIDCMRATAARPSLAGQPSRSIAGQDNEEDEDERPGVTLSGLLNVLDGFGAPDNVLFVMTTNRIEALDPALLRPGRIDYRLFMREACNSQKIALYRRFFPSATELEAHAFVETHCTVTTMAEFQGLLLGLENKSGAMDMISGAGGAELDGEVGEEVAVGCSNE